MEFRNQEVDGPGRESEWAVCGFLLRPVSFEIDITYF